ncbi:Uncharacterised protein [Mycobacterium tuberculosis]|nr:Uncharacterised protein [Mycobacterium tuberculosis]
MWVPSVSPPPMGQPVCRQLSAFTQLGDIGAKEVDMPHLATGSLGLAVEVNPGVGHSRKQMVQPRTTASLSPSG